MLSADPTIYTVNLTSAVGAGSGAAGDLVYAVAKANADPNPAGSLIKFDPAVFASPQTIILSQTLELSGTAGPETILGPGAGLLTISGNDVVRVFQVDVGAAVSMSGLTITDGVSFNGGAINNAEVLVLSSCGIVGNRAFERDLGPAPVSSSPGLGGGVYNSGSMSIANSTISENEAYAGWRRYYTISAHGGGVYNTGDLNISNCTVNGNSAGVGSRITDNPAEVGSGIYNTGALSLAQSTLSGGVATDTNSQVTTINSIFDGGLLCRKPRFE